MSERFFQIIFALIYIDLYIMYNHLSFISNYLYIYRYTHICTYRYIDTHAHTEPLVLDHEELFMHLLQRRL